MNMLVLGAGLQGSACAYDLLQNPEIKAVRLCDINVSSVAPFLKLYSGKRLFPTPLDAKDKDAVLALMREADAVMSALPYYFNLEMAKLAAEAGTNFCDLGGNTEIVIEQKKLSPIVAEKGKSIIPDCGLAPGMVNILAQYGISQLDSTESVRLYVGGLPQNPVPPLNYQVVYSLEGVLDYYTTPSRVLRDSKVEQVAALSELEDIQFEGIGELEAFHTAGGLSTMASRYEGQIPEMEYKTLRYPGHARVMEAIRDLGFLSTEPMEVNGHRVVPRDLSVSVLGKALKKPSSPDIVILRVIVKGVKDGVPKTHTFELVDRYDEKLGISAMMRTTGFSLSITGQMQAEGKIAPGVHTPDECIDAQAYIEALAQRGVKITQS